MHTVARGLTPATPCYTVTFGMAILTQTYRQRLSSCAAGAKLTYLLKGVTKHTSACTPVYLLQDRAVTHSAVHAAPAHVHRCAAGVRRVLA